MQPRYLVFILIRQELVIALCHGFLQAWVRNRINHLAITFCEGFPLIGHKMIGTEGDFLIKRLGQFDHIWGQHFARLFWVKHSPASQFKGALIALDSRAVQCDGFKDGRAAHRNQAPLPGGPENHHIGIDRVPHHHACQFRGIKQRQPIAQPRLKRDGQTVRGDLKLGVSGEFTGNDLMGVHHSPGAPRRGQPKCLGPSAHHKVAADQRIAFACGDPNGADGLGRLGQPAMNMHRAALLSETGHLHHTRSLAINLRRLRQNGTDGHNACAAHSRDHHIMRALDWRDAWLWHLRYRHIRCRFFFDLRALEGHERRAKAVHTGKVFVTARLINRPLAPQFGFHGHD